MKTNCLLLSAITVMTLAGVISPRAQVVLSDIAEATVRDSANQNVDIDEIAAGSFERVKYVADAGANGTGNTTGCAKSYFAWDFTGQVPNTNADLTITWSTVNVSQFQALRIWSLDQAFPTFTAGGSSAAPNRALTWNTAQANQTNYDLPGSFQGSFQMLTNGPFTATPRVNVDTNIEPFNVATVSVTIPAPWGNLIINNQIVLVFCGTNNTSLSGGNGYRIQINSGVGDGTVLTFNPILGTNPPSISALPNVTVTAGQNSVTNSFTVTDPDGAVASVAGAIPTVDGVIVTSATVLGSGANQQIYVTGGIPGTTTVKATVTDELGDTAQRTFTVTVQPQTFAPTISTPANTNTAINTPVTVPFIITDPSQPVSTLVVTGAVDVASANELASVAFGGSGSNRTVTVTPVTGADGVGLVDLSVSDTNGNTVTTSFTVMVVSNRTVFVEHFDYPDGLLTVGSDGLWLRRGNANPVAVNVLSQAAILQTTPAGTTYDSDYAPLLGAPYVKGNRSVIYVTFTGNWSLAPTASSGSIVGLAVDGTLSSPQVCSIASTLDIAGDGGDVNLQFANGGGAYTVVPFPITNGTPYTIAARYDVDSATATLWINATNEADTSSFTNVNATDVTTPVPLSFIDLNQAVNTGSLTLDDLTVRVVTRPLISAIRMVQTSVEIDFAASASDAPTDFGVTSTTDLTLPFGAESPVITSLGGGVFRATLPVSGKQHFYRVQRQPFSF